MRPVWAEIDLTAIEDNVRKLKSLTSEKALFMSVVKADGYGHGAVEVARAALKAGSDRLGVAMVEEALELRQAGISAPIHILSEVPPVREDVAAAVEGDLICTVCRRETAEMLSEAAVAANKQVKIHIKVDTGMNRLGIPGNADIVEEFIRYVQGLPNTDLEGIFTHFATADCPDEEFRDEQMGRFAGVLDSLAASGLDLPVKHAANSAALLTMPHSHLDMVRAGISIYGLHPSKEIFLPPGCRPALSFKAKVSFVKKVLKGEGISYGLTYSTTQDSTIATLPVGYADGYTRRLSNNTEVLTEGESALGVGTICMDQFMVDVTGIPEVLPGSTAVLIGSDGDRSITAEDVAERIGTINYEVVCMIGKRVPRIYKR